MSDTRDYEMLARSSHRMAQVVHTGGGVMAVALDLDNTEDPSHILVTYASNLDGDGVEGYDVGFYQNAADEGQIERVQDIIQIAPLIDQIYGKEMTECREDS